MQYFLRKFCAKNLHFESVVVLLQSFSNDLSKKKELYIFTNTQNIRYMSLTYFLSVLDNLFGFVFIFENYFSGVALNSTSGFFKTRLFFDALILSTSQCTKNGKKVQ